MDAFFIEWKVGEYPPVIERADSREEAHALIEKRKSEGVDVLGIWGANKWHLRSDEKIYMLSENNLKER